MNFFGGENQQESKDSTENLLTMILILWKKGNNKLVWNAQKNIQGKINCLS